MGPLGSWWTTVPFLVLLANHAVATSPKWPASLGVHTGPQMCWPSLVAGCLFLLLGPGGAFNDIQSYR